VSYATFTNERAQLGALSGCGRCCFDLRRSRGLSIELPIAMTTTPVARNGRFGTKRTNAAGSEGDTHARSCQVVWKAPNRIGVEFSSPHARSSPAVHQTHRPEPPTAAGAGASGVLRSEMLSLRVPLGIVLLDNGLRARFINRAFRTMWRLPDATAESAPAFATLMYQGRDTRAYDVPDRDLDLYVERGVLARRKSGAIHERRSSPPVTASGIWGHRRKAGVR